jgi:hypothetical protein
METDLRSKNEWNVGTAAPVEGAGAVPDEVAAVPGRVLVVVTVPMVAAVVVVTVVGIDGVDMRETDDILPLR